MKTCVNFSLHINKIVHLTLLMIKTHYLIIIYILLHRLPEAIKIILARTTMLLLNAYAMHVHGVFLLNRLIRRFDYR